MGGEDVCSKNGIDFANTDVEFAYRSNNYNRYSAEEVPDASKTISP